jgi:hypothetical protein
LEPLIGNQQSGFGLNSLVISDRLFLFTPFSDLGISQAIRVSSEFQAILGIRRSVWSQLVTDRSFSGDIRSVISGIMRSALVPLPPLHFDDEFTEQRPGIGVCRDRFEIPDSSRSKGHPTGLVRRSPTAPCPKCESGQMVTSIVQLHLRVRHAIVFTSRVMCFNSRHPLQDQTSNPRTHSPWGTDILKENPRNSKHNELAMLVSCGSYSRDPECQSKELAGGHTVFESSDSPHIASAVVTTRSVTRCPHPRATEELHAPESSRSIEMAGMCVAKPGFSHEPSRNASVLDHCLRSPVPMWHRPQMNSVSIPPQMECASIVIFKTDESAETLPNEPGGALGESLSERRTHDSSPSDSNWSNFPLPD